MNTDHIIDPALEALVQKAASDDKGIGITLIVRGAVVSGHLISAHDYFQAAAQRGENREIQAELRKMHHEFHPGGVATPESEAMVKDKHEAYIHLRDATVSGAPVRLWRCRLASVDAFAL